MGNEASLEGGDGGLSGLPDGQGGIIHIPEGMEADLSKLSAEERRQIATVMSRAQPGEEAPSPRRKSEVDANHQPSQAGKPPTQGPSGISKSRTVDAFKTGSPGRQVPPGRSPSSISLLESRSRQEVREEQRSTMFSSGFLSGANPLSAVSSAVNKFNLFGDDEDDDAKKQKQAQQQAAKSPGQQPGPSKSPQQQGPRPPQQQGIPKQGQGPPQQGPGSLVPQKSGSTGPQQQGPKTAEKPQQGAPKGGQQTQAPPKSGPQKQGPPGAQTQGPSKPGGAPQQGPPKGGQPEQQTSGQPGPRQPHPHGPVTPQGGPAKSAPFPQGPVLETGPARQKLLCPLCNTTELNVNTKDPPNYNTCTECKNVVCSLCGFSPPDSTVKEWLCLNCQMQRALGGMEPPGPAMMKPQAKQTPATPSPQKKQTRPAVQPPKAEPAKPPEAKKPSPLVKQQLTADAGKSATPPVEKKAPVKGPEEAKPGEQPLAKKPPVVQKPGNQPAPPSVKPAVTGSPDLAKLAGPAEVPSKPGQQPAQQKLKQQPASKPQQVQPPAQQQPPAGPPKVDPKTGPSIQDTGNPKPQAAKPSPGPSPSKAAQPSKAPPTQQPPKQETGFFSLSFGGFAEAAKSQSTTPQPSESVSGKLFGFGAFTESSKTQATSPQPSESVSGKMFGFGSSIFSSASSLLSSAVQDEHPAQKPAEQVTPAAPKEPTSALPSAKAPAVSETKPEDAQKLEQQQPVKGSSLSLEKKLAPAKAEKPQAEPRKQVVAPVSPSKTSTPPSKASSLTPKASTSPSKTSDTPSIVSAPPSKTPDTPPKASAPPSKTSDTLPKASAPPSKTPDTLPKVSAPPSKESAPPTKTSARNCPLCKVDLNVGSKDPPSYNTCTECKNTVCNLCGFNPMPHLTENEWLCLSCQTQRALAGQLGDMGSMPPPSPVPIKPSSQQPVSPKGQPISVSQPATQPKSPEPSPPRPTPIQQKTELPKTAPPSTSPPVALPAESLTEPTTVSQAPSEKPGGVAQALQRSKEVKKADAVTKQEEKPTTAEAKKEREDKYETPSQQKSPQGLSDTGYSSEGLSGSLGDVVVSTVKKELLKEPVQKEAIVQETSPTSPSDLAKLESTVLSILEAKTSSVEKDPGHPYDQERNQHRRKLLPISPESFSSEEEDLDDFQEDESPTKDKPSEAGSRRDRRKLQDKKDATLARRQRQDSMEDSSGSEPSPLLQRRKISIASTSSEEYKPDSPGSGDDEEFIRKQIMEMSADEDASGSDEDSFVRRQIREQDQKREQDERKGKTVTAKPKRPMKKGISSQEDDPEWRPSRQEKKEEEQIKTIDPRLKETKSQEEEELSTVGGLRRFKTIELNNTTATPYKEGTPVQKSMEEGDLDMESLTDSPEDRSRGEGSSSLHASSFTPGTSPTSVSSLDEDSDSSPSHKRMSGEGKHRKARHRQPGQVLPTIEDSSEEEEMREEEELLKEQEKQREVDQQQQVKKSSSKKSKKEKEELRAQRRREHPKTPPSNLSPIEDASPTEELRQAAEMEELHKSSCSEYSPSIESEPEGFQIDPEKILAVQKVYQLPTSVSLYSPTEDQNTDASKYTTEKSLKTADEAYEEMMQKAKALQGKKEPDTPLEKEPLYGGMLIEDYIYESLVEEGYDEAMPKNNAAQQESSTIPVQKPGKKLRSPDEVYEEMMQKRKDMILKEEDIQIKLPVKEHPQVERVSHPAAEIQSVTVFTSESSTKDGKPLLDAEAAYEELMKRQRVNLTPGTSPTQPAPDIHASPDVIVISSGDGVENTKGQSITITSVYDQEPLSRALYPIPDLKITQCSSGEEDIEEEDSTAQKQKADSSTGVGADQSLPSTTGTPAAPTPSVAMVTEQSVRTAGDFQQPEAAPVLPSQPPAAVSSPVAAAAPLMDSASAVVTTETPSPAPHPSPPATLAAAPPQAHFPVQVQTQVAHPASTPATVFTSAPASVSAPAPVAPSPPPSPPPPPTPPPLPPSIRLAHATPMSPSLKNLPNDVPMEAFHFASTSAPSQLTESAVSSIPASPHVPEAISGTPTLAAPSVAPPVMRSAEEHVVILVPSFDSISATAETSHVACTYAAPSSYLFSSAAPSTAVSFSPLPTVPQYTPTIPSVMSTPATATILAAAPTVTGPPVPPKPAALLRGSSLERADTLASAGPPPPPPPPPLPPPTMPKPAIYPKKKPPFSTPAVVSVPSVPVSTAITMAYATITTAGPSTALKNSVAPTYRPHMPPPVPPKPSTIPVGLMFNHKPGESVKPPLAPKPMVTQPSLSSQGTAMTQSKPIAPPSTTAMMLNLSAPTEVKLSIASPQSTLSPRYTNSLHETYVVITLPSEPGTPVEGISTQAPCSPSSKQPLEVASTAPVAFTQYTKSIESQEIQGPEKLVSSTNHVYSSVSASVQPAVTLPNLVAQIVTTEVQRTTVSVVHERLPTIVPTPAPRTTDVAVPFSPEITKTQLQPKENEKTYYSGDVVDLRTLKVNIEMTDKGMDLSVPDVKRTASSSEIHGRQTSAVQSEIVNLSAEATPTSTLSIVTSTITIVTCTATIAYDSKGADKPLDLAQSTAAPLQLTSRQYEPVAQIIYRPIDSQPTTSAVAEAPINLSFGTIKSTDTSKLPMTAAPPSITNGSTGFLSHLDGESVGAVDLTTSKPVQTMVAVNGVTSGVVTTIIEDDGKPVDLTAGRRAVCCDVVYKLPFAGSCTRPQAAATLPEDRFGYRDDHYQYDRSGSYSTRSFGGMKPSMSDTNLAEAGLFFYKSKNSYDYNGATEGAVDLTSGKISTGEIVDYSTKGTGTYPGMTIPPFSQARIAPPVGTHFGVSSVLRSSNGVVYSSVAAPVPSTYAITTQPGSIFSTTYKDLSGMHSSDTMPSLSTLQNQPLPRSYSFLSTTVAAQEEPLCLETGVSKTALAVTFPEVVPTVTTMQDSYTDASLEAIAASLEALSSPIIPVSDDTQQQYQMEREYLEMEKIKQLRLAEELEWERQEIQRFREQEQLLVQKELEELQTMKQQILLQQEEERQAHLMMQQETYAQQQLQLEQIQQLQQQLQQQLEEQKMRQIYGYDPSESTSPPVSSEQILLGGGTNGQYWPVQEETATSSVVTSLELQQNPMWYTVPTEGIAQYITSLPGSEISIKEAEGPENLQISNRMPRGVGQYDQLGTDMVGKKIVDSGVQTDDEDDMDRAYTGRRKRNKKSVDSSVQTDDEDQDEWDIPTRSRRRSRSSKYGDDKAKQGSKVSSIAIQTVAEISVQTEASGTIKKPSIRAQTDSKVEIVKHISAPEKTYRGGSLSCQTGADADAVSPTKEKRRPTPLEIGYNTHLKADSTLHVAASPPKSPKVLYSPISPLSPSKSLEFVQYDKSAGDASPQKVVTTEPSKPPPSPRTLKVVQRSMSDPKPLSPTSEERASSSFQYSDGYSGKASQTSTSSGTQKKVKRTLPNPPPEEETAAGQIGYSTGSARRRLCRNTTMARAKILQDIDRELDLVERESSKLRKKQAELDEEEKEIDAKLRYLEMGINRRKDALLKEREKRERAYLQGVAEERDYMSDSEVSNIREGRGNGHGLERPRTAPQSEFNQFIPPQTQPEAQYGQDTSPYSQYQYAPQTQAASQYPQQTLTYQQQSLYHQQVSPYQTQSIYSSVPTLSYPHASHQQSQQQNYQHASQMLLMQQKPRQTTLSDLEPKITTNYEVIRNQPLMMVPSSTDSTYVPHLGSKYSSLDLRMGLEERSSMASSPMSSISADSFYADIDHHTPRNYVLIDDIGELTKSSAGLSSTFSIPDKDLTKADRLLRAAEVRRTAEVTDFLGPLQVSSRLHPYGKAEEDTMEDPYELKLLKQQIKQEFRRGTEGLDHLTGLPHYYPGDSSYRHFPKTEKYSISRLTLEKQAAKQLPASVLYQKQAKHKKALMDPKLSKFSPIQEGRDLEPDYGSYLASGASSVSGLASRARLLQDDITFGLRKNISEQQKYLGSTLGANLAQSLNLGQTLNLGPTMRSSLQDDTTYPSGSRSRPSSRPSSVYGLDLSLKRDLSSSSLRLKTENEPLDVSFSSPSVRTKPTSLPISQSRGRIPIVAQNSEEESPLSPVGQPMGMARASAGPLPPISADSRDQFGSSHSLPEVQQHMREESRTRGYDRDIAFMMDDLQGAMSDSEALSDSLVTLNRDDPRNSHENIKNAYHLRREETDWFDKPREARAENGHAAEKRQGTHKHQQGDMKPVQYPFPHTRVKLQRDSKDHSVSGNGFGIRVVGGKEIPGTNGEIGAYIAKVLPGGAAEQTGKIMEGIQVLEWNGVPLTSKTYEEVQGLVGQQCSEAEICVRLDLNMLSDSEQPQRLELHDPTKAGDRQRSPGVDPKQLAAELQKVSQQQGPSLSATEKGPHPLSGTTSAASSAVPSPGQPGSPSVSKKRHSSKPGEASKTPSHPITGEIQLQINYDKHLGNLIVHVLQARNLAPRDNNGYSDPFVKVYLLPGRGAENKRRTKYAQKSLNPEWNQTVIYKNIHLEQLKKKTLEVTVWDYDRSSSNDFLGEVLIDLSNTAQLDNTPRWFPLKEQSETIDHGARPHSGQGSSQQSPKPSVIKSRSHGIFPDPSKDMQVPTIEKSHSSPASSKSSSEGHLRSHGPSRSQSKSSVTQAHLEDAGVAIAAAEAAVQQLRLQPIDKRGLASRAKEQYRHSVAGVLTIQRTQSDSLPAPAIESKDTSQLTLRKSMSEGTTMAHGARPGHRAPDATMTTTTTSSGFNLEGEGGGNAIDSAIFQVPRIGKTIPNGTDKPRGPDSLGFGDTEGKTQVMGEIKIALKKEMKTEGEQLIVEILQCRNITYKFKSPDHLPGKSLPKADLYVKLYVVNVATQKKVIKKKTRVCRHDREPSFNETFRFNMNPAGHSIQLFLVSNGGKFMKKTLIGEAYIWLDKVDLRKRVVNWHKLLVSSTQTHP
ncbi:protein piccolo-like isoform X1 [Arapaima gigas]